MKILTTRIFAFQLFILFCAGGCASVATSPDELENADYGSYPENYKEFVREYFETRLKDPFSAKYRFNGLPQRAYARKAPVQGGGVAVFGFLVYVDVNAKNSFGGYTGWDNHRLLIRNGQVVHSFTPNPWFSEPWYK